MTDTPKPRLSEEGQIYVTLRAAQQWLEANDFAGLEEARRDLTELMLDAYRTTGDQVRLRASRDKLDLQARVTVDGRLLVVRDIHVRALVQRTGQRRIVR